jgi:hypothetical protein
MIWYEACICFSLCFDMASSVLVFYKISLAAYCNYCYCESIELYCILDDMSMILYNRTSF